MRQRNRLLGMLLASITFAGLPHAHGQTTVTKERIAEAWKAREKRVRSAKFVWTERTTIPKGQMTEEFSDPVGQIRLKEMGITPGELVPPRDTTFDVLVKVLIDGNNMRFEREDRAWSSEKKAYVPNPYISTFDGRNAKVFRPLGAPYSKFPYGSIHAESQHLDTGNLLLAPLLNTVRPVDKTFRTLELKSMTLSNLNVKIGGHTCVELQLKHIQYVMRVWVDPIRDFVVVRRMDSVNGKVLIAIDVQFRQADGFWFPHSWNIVNRRHDGHLDKAIQAVVIDSTINPSIPTTDFNSEFLPGTKVRDLRADQRYIVRANGKKRMIEKGERNQTYEQLMANGLEEELLPKQGWNRLLVASVTGVLIIVALTTWWCWPSKTRNPSNTNASPSVS